jgi:hypothetical protein
LTGAKISADLTIATKEQNPQANQQCWQIAAPQKLRDCEQRNCPQGGTHMRMKIGALGAVAGIMLAFGAPASRAAIVETIINTDSDAAVGSIAFPTLTGDSDAGVFPTVGLLRRI